MAFLDPKMRAITPNTNTITFFQMIQLHFPKPCSQYVTISIAMGINRPKMEKQKAPIRPINGAIVGTATANNTAAATKTVL